jgi:hypothetical protein
MQTSDGCHYQHCQLRRMAENINVLPKNSAVWLAVKQSSCEIIMEVLDSFLVS